LFTYHAPRPTTFFLQLNDDGPKRGFVHFQDSGVFHARYSEPYVPRNQAEPDPEKRKFEYWKLLGHLVVAPNPFAKGYPETDLLVILLMGVGGPATLGLAHLLTGRTPPCRFKEWSTEKSGNSIRDSGKFLEDMNRLVREHKGAEAIIEIDVLNDMASMHNDYEDSREIQGIRVADSLGGMSNPKKFTLGARNSSQR
jgi:hypothetical protein